MSDETQPPSDLPTDASAPAEPAQIPVSEPVSEPVVEPAPTAPELPETEVLVSPSAPPAEPVQTPAPTPVPPPAPSTLSQTTRELLAKARSIMQAGKQKKLEKIMTAIEANGKISNNEVEKLLHCSDATATRYLSELEKQGRVRKIGKGRALHYEKI